VSVNGADDGHVILDITSLDAGSLLGGHALTITGSAEANTLIGGTGNERLHHRTKFAPGEVIKRPRG